MSPPYRHADLELLPLGGDRVLAVHRQDGRAVSLRAADAEVLKGCTRYATLAEHAAGRGAEVGRRLERLVRKRLLVPPPVPAVPDEAAPVRAVAVVTRDRPEALHRLLRSLPRDLPVEVFDDGRDPARRQALREELAALGVGYAGEEEKLAYAGRLAARSQVPPRLVARALTGGSDIAWREGGNRNALHLQHLGAGYLCLDDDVIWRFTRPPGPRRLPRVTSGGALHVFDFFADTPDALARTRFTEVDAVAEVGAVLGRAVPALVEGGWDAASPALADRLPTARVAVAEVGGVGDSGGETPWFAMHLDGVSHERALADWERARTSRAMLRMTEEVVLSDRPALMTMTYGMDARRLLPPFATTGRNCDGLFARTLRVLCPGELIAHLPLAIHHEPPEARAYAPDAVWAGILRLQVAEILMWSIEGHEVSPRLTRAERFAAVGRAALEVGRSAARLEELLRSRWRHRCANLAATLEQRLALPGPPAWHDDLRRALDAQVAAASAPPVPVELSHLPRPEALARLAGIVRDQAALLGAWPEVVAAARDLADGPIPP